MTERAHLAFALALHHALAPDPTEDACWSPYSVASALGVASQAAQGGTRAELLTLLVGDPDRDVRDHAVLLAEAGALRGGARGGGGGGGGSDARSPELAVTNTLWVWDELPVNGDFVTDLAGWPGHSVRTAPFATDPEAARAAINADVAATTHDLIPELVPPGAVAQDTVATLVNALYLRTAWRTPFDANDTRPKPFHAPDGPRPVPTMRHTGQLTHAAQDGWTAVGLPAHGGVEAVVLLPDGDLAAAEPGLDVPRLTALLAARTRTRVELHLPRCRARARAALTAALTGLGVRTLFSRSADLGALSPDPRLSVSDVLHEAVLRVDEQGLEGAAATAMMIRMTSMPVHQEPPLVIRVDRPFLLLVRHQATGALYFLARITRP
ncbi:serpin family protein [Goodfellowiella coeruleoviolacea]|uniref:Serpin B n=1 Tax=Goodfellowiella coeruleoviolacea TaxID=334858 RepID=A0AAE3GD61_9PSEU|nr:serpin family protein [Goodfellowiella coeruleoviolacea]MCP2165204.1 serpin B [Goodfellowiella coeruleoviolacea]